MLINFRKTTEFICSSSYISVLLGVEFHPWFFMSRSFFSNIPLYGSASCLICKWSPQDFYRKVRKQIRVSTWFQFSAMYCTQRFGLKEWTFIKTSKKSLMKIFIECLDGWWIVKEVNIFEKYFASLFFEEKTILHKYDWCHFYISPIKKQWL